jgi:GTPase
MNKLFKIEAEIKINKRRGRTWPIKTGYRPGFRFIDKKQTSGSINLLSREYLKPGEEGVVEVTFVSNELLGHIKEGTVFRFYEGPVEIGIGKILKIFGWIEVC